MTMTETETRPFKVGDTVRFKRATLPVNRERDYTVVEASPGGLTVTVNGSTYSHTFGEAERLGIAHAPEK